MEGDERNRRVNTIGLRTRCLPSDHSKKPNSAVPDGNDVDEKLTLLWLHHRLHDLRRGHQYGIARVPGPHIGHPPPNDDRLIGDSCCKWYHKRWVVQAACCYAGAVDDSSSGHHRYLRRRIPEATEKEEIVIGSDVVD
ncbi:hypothetical protein EJ110_NYTH09630 [Nymphaea thermarum]|nr:hypothetical protein EJ110_NYTH09630 [Nymphaea thermarum]